VYPIFIRKERRDVEQFDLLFYRGSGVAASIISKVTKSPYTHVALVLDEFHLVEADWYHPLAIRHIEYRTENFDIYRVGDLDDVQRSRIKRYIYETINSPYDYPLVLSHLLKYFFGGKLLFNSPRRFDCSEWVDLAFNYAGIDLLPNTQISTVTPADLVKSPKLTLVKG
jgi:uncharacterized protein YycO